MSGHAHSLVPVRIGFGEDISILIVAYYVDVAGLRDDHFRCVKVNSKKVRRTQNLVLLLCCELWEPRFVESLLFALGIDL